MHIINDIINVITDEIADEEEHVASSFQDSNLCIAIRFNYIWHITNKSVRVGSARLWDTLYHSLPMPHPAQLLCFSINKTKIKVQKIWIPLSGSHSQLPSTERTTGHRLILHSYIKNQLAHFINYG